LLDVACGVDTPVQAPGDPDIAIHQLLLAVLGASERSGKRRVILSELGSALRHRASYHNSAEELTPLRHDLRTVIPIATAAAATLAHPATWRWFSSGAVTNYALTAVGWREILSRQNP
jgi:hypothetical protein